MTWACCCLLQKRLKENEALALEFTATELFEAASLAKGQEWSDMAPAGKKKYEELASGQLGCACMLHWVDQQTLRQLVVVPLPADKCNSPAPDKCIPVP